MILEMHTPLFFNLLNAIENIYALHVDKQAFVHTIYKYFVTECGR